MNGWLILMVFAASSVLMVFGWLWQRKSGNAGIVDVIWSGGMAASAVFYGAMAEGALLPRDLVAVMGGIWGVRLCSHIFHRVINEEEDGRYKYLREHWNGSQTKFLLFFFAQALLTALFSIPFWIAAHNPESRLTVWYVIAMVVWLISVGGEALADRQLARHRADPSLKGKTCRSGLWRYSRHPNYFFEWLHWFSYVFLAIGLDIGWVLLSMLGAALMFGTLFWVTGIPFTEQQPLRSRGEDYREYQRTTSIFIPWFPKNSDHAMSKTQEKKK